MSLKHLAILGGKPEFEQPVPVGQLYFPSWEKYENTIKGVFDRQYYTNHGPLAQRLEANLAEFLNVNHVVCVTNATIGLIMGAEALALSGKVLTPSFTFIATALSLSRCGIQPIFCDIDPTTLHITPETLSKAYTTGVSGVLGVNLFGSAADVAEIDRWANTKGLKIYWDSSQALGCSVNEKKLSGNGDLEIFSLHATKIISSAEGGFITTNDAHIANRLRHIRSSYGASGKEAVTKTSNGRMSELQAAIGLLSLEDYHKNVARNHELRDIYRSKLSGLNGITLEPFHGVSSSNASSVIIRVDEKQFGTSSDILSKALAAENVLARRYFEPGAHRAKQFAKSSQWDLPQTERAQKSILALPLGARVTEKIACTISRLISEIATKAKVVTNELR